MGKTIYLDKVKRLFEKSPVVDMKSIERIIGKKSKDNNYAKLLIQNLVKRNIIKRLSKGYYTKYDEISLAVFCFKPAYLGLQSALSYHGLWEQETIPIVLTIKKVRRGIRKVLGNNVLLRNIDKRYFFGFDYFNDGGFYLPYSDIEKTLIDMIIFKEKIDEDTLNRIKSKINKKNLEKYLKFYSSNVKKRVLSLVAKKV